MAAGRSEWRAARVGVLTIEINAMSGDSCEERDSTLARLGKELGQVRQALSLLGLRACSQCGRFFRVSENGGLFDGGELVCMGCLQHWWQMRSAQLSVNNRDVIERRLVSWLVNHHGGKVVQWGKQPADTDRFRIVTSCAQCDGAGTLAGRRCASCSGRGTVLVLASK